MHDNRSDNFRQRNIILSYNLLVDALKREKVKTDLVKLDEQGVCNGLCFAYKLYAHQGQREEFFEAMKLLASIDKEEDFIRLIQNRNSRNAFFETGEHHLNFNKMIALLEGIRFSQTNQSLKEIGVLWEKTYSFICLDTELSAYLKNVNWQNGESAFMSMMYHVFYVEKSELGFYLFEPNNIEKYAIQPVIESEEQLARVILNNIRPFITVENYLAFSIQFISYASTSKNTMLDHAIFDMGEKLQALKPYPRIQSLCDDYRQKKLSRLDCALAIWKMIAQDKKILEDKEEHVQGLIKAIEQYLQNEKSSVDRCLEYNSKAINKTAYYLCVSLLFIASAYGQQNLVEKILKEEKMLNPNLQTYKFSSPLYIASQQGHADCVRLLFSHPDVNVNLRSSTGASPLYIASQQGHTDCVRLLVSHPDVNVNLQTKIGATPLFIASEKGHTDCVRLLVSHPDVNVNLQSNTGSTPLFIASQQGHTDCVKLLVSHPGINVSSRLDNGATPLYISAQNGHRDIVDLLIQHGASIDAPIDAETQFLLDRASKNGKNITLQQAFEINNMGSLPATLQGFTPLHAAIFFGHDEVLKSLLDAGANIHATTGGLSCLEIARIMDNKKIVELLENRLDSENKSSLSI